MVRISDSELVAMWDSGLTMTEIAAQVGLSRERVRQRLKPHGRSGSNPNAVPSAAEIRAAFAEEASMQHAAWALGISLDRLARGIERAGIKDEIETVILARRQEGRRQSAKRRRATLVIQVRTLAQRLGHTPTQSELMQAGIYHVELARLFGSATSAMENAGLTPNVRGLPPYPLPNEFLAHD